MDVAMLLFPEVMFYTCTAILNKPVNVFGHSFQKEVSFD